MLWESFLFFGAPRRSSTTLAAKNSIIGALDEVFAITVGSQGGDIQARETDGQYFPEGEQVLIAGIRGGGGGGGGGGGSVDATS